MDFWLVAAVAGAGYLSKYWQSLLRDTRLSQQLLSSSDDLVSHKPESSGCPLRVLTNRPKKRANVGETTAVSNHVDLGELLLSNLNVAGNADLEDSDDDYSYGLPSSLSMEEVGTRNRSSIRTKRSHGVSIIKPVNSLESCLLAQLQSQSNDESEEYAGCGSLQSRDAVTMRSLVVTNGSRVTNRSRRVSFSAQSGTEETEVCVERDSSTRLFSNGLMKHSVESEAEKTRKEQNGERNGFDCHDGSSNETFILCLGISVGIMFSVVTSKREADKMTELLKQSENLVQDLQEELEMKDSITVKELANDNYDPRDTSTDSVFERACDLNIDSRDLCIQKEDEGLESISIIEAELEAELERLGLNMNAPTLERQSCNVTEVDPDLSVDFARGELRVDMLGLEGVSKSMSNDDDEDTPTTHETANYAVSPRELSLRLHEVIQSRLEERVNGLEIALQNSQRKIQVLQSGVKNSNGRPRYLAMQERYLAPQESSITKEPLVLDLSGEALEAYNVDLMRVSDSEEDEDSPRRVYEDIHCNQVSLDGIFQGQDLEFPEERSIGLRTRDENVSLVLGSNDTSNSCDDISDCDDETERELIKQIVERTKKGSAVVVNAQKLLFSLEENDTLK